MTNRNHFIIVGERRSGTTTLYDLLCKHSEISMLNIADYDFFIEPELFSKVQMDDIKLKNWEEHHDISDYWKLFSNEKKISGQKDADLLWWKPAHKRLARLLPNTKFLVVLRNPVRRAESQYYNEFAKGREKQSFEAAIQREETQILTDWERLHLQYKERGCYSKSLKEFYKIIPKSRVKVIILEELINNFENEILSICSFLELDGQELLKLKPVHSNQEKLLERKSFAKNFLLKRGFDIWERLVEGIIVRLTMNKSKRDKYRHRLMGFYNFSRRRSSVSHEHQEIKRYLKNYYQFYNKQLEELIGKSLNYWQND